MIVSIPLIFWDGERLFRMRSLAKRRRERIKVLEELRNYLEADFRASFKRCGELIKENTELYDELNKWRNPTAY